MRFWNTKSEGVLPRPENASLPENPKYELLTPGKRFSTGKLYETLYRVRAIIDIPEQSVKTGELGGWVSGYSCLSDEGIAWIAGEAKIFSRVCVKDDAYIGGKAKVWVDHINHHLEASFISDKAKITGLANVASCTVSGKAIIGGEAQVYASTVAEEAVIHDDATVRYSMVKGKAIIRDKSIVYSSQVSGETYVTGRASVNAGCVLKGKNYLMGNVRVPPNTVLEGKILKDDIVEHYPKTTVEQPKTVEPYEFNETEMKQAIHEIFEEFEENNNSGQQKSLTNKQPEILTNDNTFAPIGVLENAVVAIEEEYNSYSHDIIKLIKYPLMTDPTFEPVGRFLQKLRKVKRYLQSDAISLTEEMVDDLELAFLAMEAECIKLSSHGLSEKAKKNLDLAGNLVSMALDDAASEQEKMMAAKKALSTLEGVLMVPQEAVESFRTRAGLKELTA